MDKRMKDMIKTIKEDKKSFKKYIKSFCDSEKAQELFKNNDEFKRLQEKSKQKDNE